jgi:hypothetical protein
MDSFDRHLVQFLVTWAPFGGPADEDTYPRFGLRGRRLWNRFDRIVARAESVLPELEDDDAELIERARALIALQLVGDPRHSGPNSSHALRPTPHYRPSHEHVTPM